jgi:hypothetical protein
LSKYKNEETRVLKTSRTSVQKKREPDAKVNSSFNNNIYTMSYENKTEFKEKTKRVRKPERFGQHLEEVGSNYYSQT